MAITRKVNEESTVDTVITSAGGGKPISDVKSKQDDQKVSKTERKEIKAKKVGFVASTIDEMKKMEWPGYKYILKWSGLVILFTFIFSMFLGSVDHLFGTMVKVVDCTSPEAKNKKITECGDEIINYLTFK